MQEPIDVNAPLCRVRAELEHELMIGIGRDCSCIQRGHSDVRVLHVGVSVFFARHTLRVVALQVR